MVARLVFVSVLAVTAQQQATPSLREQLRPLEFLVGSCWTGSFPGGTATDTHCFESVFGGQFVRDRHVVRGGKRPYEGETLYGWDPKQKKVVYTYWASDGAMSTGQMEPGQREIVFSESHASETGELKMRNLWTATGADRYDVVVTQLKDGEWRDMWRMTMRRDPRGFR